MRLALFEPDIPQNTGTILRMAACLGVSVDLIEPAGFIINNKLMKRAGMDYLNHADLTIHKSWKSYIEQRQEKKRIILLTTKATTSYINFKFNPDDTLLLGRETSGVPSEIHDVVDARLKIPMQERMRSLNVAIAAAIVLGDALKQTNQLPEFD
ncbi:MAG: tRNA methyltransferase [Alphaproteobacteria bacterium]|mgnify:FL=1|jgi:tRNA (cytidine/uridine-2'-O-)-methyltransferase|nr:tRNA methyltransferase [Alphaproteobacteria bacterium]PPR14367.1 MAG: tRNA (cytidine(34)-2'-O)-methyltransferase [Alphaproteobacteria bacterium MarineAlpha12_Bin1]|tara:strand:+ start:17518 stop:17979 length:462 start_codon:yes stop_codon:yes gene_type:complete